METKTSAYIAFGMAVLSLVIALGIYFFVLDKRTPVVLIPPVQTTTSNTSSPTP